MRDYELLLESLESYLPDPQIEKIKAAFEFAKRAHEGQVRLSGEPYITHPVQVSLILAKLHLDHESIMAALLHDVIEDTEADKPLLAKQFSAPVAELVDGVSKLDQLQFASRAEAQAESFRKMLISMAKDIRVILVKLADRLHNMRTLSALPPNKQRRIARETIDIYAPIAHRIGMNHFRVELEDLGFSAYYPMRHRILKNAVEKLRGHRKNIIGQIAETIKKAVKEKSIDLYAINGREKHVYSIYQKMRERKISFHEVNDVYALRLITESRDDCYRILGIIHELYKPIYGKFKDYIATPKSNGYQSLHTLLFGPQGVPIEIQIRTQKMHENAELGIASHWLYKSPEASIDRAKSLTHEWLQRLLEIQANTHSSLEFIEDIKTELFPEDVYVFTPTGEILELPQGATPVDFAYAIHTDLGRHCVTARVDKHLVPLSLPLKTGQTVEIVTAKAARPNPSWLEFVITGKARTNIRHFLKNQQRHESISLGNRLLANALNDLSLSLEKIEGVAIQSLLTEHNLNSIEDLFLQMGLGNQTALMVANRLAELAGVKSLILPEQSAPLTINGLEGMAIQLPECCYPIPGDPVVGFLNPGKGITIHHALCQQGLQLAKKNHAQFPVDWEKQAAQKFKAEIKIIVEDLPGLLASIASDVATHETNIKRVHSQALSGGYARICLLLEVQNRQQLAKVMRTLRNNTKIRKITRSRA